MSNNIPQSEGLDLDKMIEKSMKCITLTERELKLMIEKVNKVPLTKLGNQLQKNKIFKIGEIIFLFIFAYVFILLILQPVC